MKRRTFLGSIVAALAAPFGGLGGVAEPDDVELPELPCSLDGGGNTAYTCCCSTYNPSEVIITITADDGGRCEYILPAARMEWNFGPMRNKPKGECDGTETS